MLGLVFILGWLVMGFLTITLLAFLGRYPEWDVFCRNSRRCLVSDIVRLAILTRGSYVPKY